EGVRAWWDHWTVNPRPDGSPVPFGPVVTDLEALLLAVAQGEGIALLPAAARELYPRPGLGYADIAGLPPVAAALAWLPARSECRSVAALCEAARTVRRAQGAGTRAVTAAAVSAGGRSGSGHGSGGCGAGRSLMAAGDAAASGGGIGGIPAAGDSPG